MKNPIVIVLFLFLSVGLAGTALCEINDSLIAYYPLDGNVEDSGPGGFDGLEFGVGWTEDSVSGSSLSLDGNGSFVDLQNHINFEYDQPFSISFWIKPDAVKRGIVISKREKSKEKTGWELLLSKKNHLVFNMCGLKKHNRIIARTRNAYVDLNSYYHVVLTYDGSSFGSGITFFVDGKEQPTVSKTLMPLTGSIQTDAHLNIGAKDNLAYKRQKQFKGLIDELSFYNKALSPEEVKDFFHAFSGGGSLVDSDGDGVPDKWDQCPDTQPGLPVCSDGCAATSCSSGDTQPPYDGTISVSNGAAATSSALVGLNISATDDQGVAGYLVSEEDIQPGADHLDWISVASVPEFEKSIAFVLTPDEGTKNLYAWFKDGSGNVSEPAETSVIVSFFKLPDTGQKLSYTFSFGEDSDYTGNAPSLTSLDAETVRDNNTNLIWQRKDDQVPRDHFTATTQCEGLSLGGYSDWRLPTVKELISILDFDEVAPAINTTHFNSTAANFGNYYWTSTVHPNDSVQIFQC